MNSFDWPEDSSSWWQGEDWGGEPDKADEWKTAPWEQGSWSVPSTTQTQPEEEDLGSLGYFDFSSLDCLTKEMNVFENSAAKYLHSYRGQEWIKMNYDSGAATTAFPIALAGEIGLKKRGEFIVASGQGIPDYGRVRLNTIDENETPRRISGSVTEVHKPLGSAAEMSATHDSFILEAGGALVPRWSPIAIGMRKAYEELVWRHGTEGVLPLYREGNLYNFYLRKVGDAKQLNPMEDGGSGGAAVAAAPGNLSGNFRQVQKP